MTTPEDLISKNLYEFYDRLAHCGKLESEKNDGFSVLKNEPGVWPAVIYKVNKQLLSGTESELFTKKVNEADYPGFLVGEEKVIEQISPFLRDQKFFLFGAWKGMILEQAVPFTGGTGNSVVIDQLTSNSDLLPWTQIVSDELLHPAILNVNFLTELLLDESFEAFLLKSNGEAISTALTFENTNSIGLYLIATTKSKQHKGFGQILMHFVLNRLAGRTKKPVILQATTPGEKLYSKLGFIPVNRFFLFRQLKK